MKLDYKCPVCNEKLKYWEEQILTIERDITCGGKVLKTSKKRIEKGDLWGLSCKKCNFDVSGSKWVATDEIDTIPSLDKTSKAKIESMLLNLKFDNAK